MNPFECPVNDWDCPYYDEGFCTLLAVEGVHPLEGCGDAISVCDPLDDYEGGM